MVSFLTYLSVAACCIGLSTSSPTGHVTRQSSWPNGPFNSYSNRMVDASNNTVKYAGVNWPGHGEAMVPEGLQYRSIADIVSDIKSLGMNAIRLTYAIEMIDQIYANDGVDVPIGTAFTEALGSTNGTAVLNKILANNPEFTADTTRTEVFDAVAAECERQEIYIHLDNHISKGMWCCSQTDGNAWFGDEYFNVENWVRGLVYMANHAKSWPNFLSMALRNEFRQATGTGSGNAESYSWETWYYHIKQATAAINAANPDTLIFLSGLNYDTTLQPVVQGTALTPGTQVFDVEDFPGFRHKLVLELHNYANSATSCSSLKSDLATKGFQALDPSNTAVKNAFPVLMTEWGFLQTDSTWKGVYTSCLAQFLPEGSSGWMYWVIVGSYYSRSGTQDFDETWGLYNHDWSGWRNNDYIEGSLKPMVAATLA
ncbi:beta-1,6-galactanase [Dactylonectria estremocensis]|uniref:Beta-1,6-galactanase n=1 Tax=Dactylonectria estremocensis TaxID=1079267 RepID=A0A9P9DGI6_9HYPO|nr:beta-1,6-galactanase [Dactylonectria estremocensis]